MGTLKKTIKFKIFISLLVALFGATILVPLYTAHAAPGDPSNVQLSVADANKMSLSWVNEANIRAQIGGNTFNFFDQDIGDADFNYKIQNYTICPGDIWLNTTNDIPDGTKASRTNVGVQPPGSVGVPCQQVQLKNVGITEQQNFDIRYQYMDAGKTQIGRVDFNNQGDNFVFHQDAATDPNLYIRTADTDGCQDRLYVNPSNNTYKMYVLKKGTDSNSPLPANLHTAGCKTTTDREGGWILVVNNLDFPLGQGATATDSGGVDGSTANVPGISCMKSWGNPLTWILCPAVDIAAKGAAFFDGVIKNLLRTDLHQFDETVVGSQGTPGGQQLFTSWSIIRNMSVALLVIIMLAAIISQAISIGPFDAYAVKKVLPRAVAAVIIALLSWYLCRIFISFSNAVGDGIQGILFAPFGGVNGVGAVTTKINLTNGSDGLLGVGGILAAGSALSVGSIGIVLVTIGMALLAAFVGFLVIVARNIAIIALVITAPIAITLWILPNTKKYADLWWDAFSRGLFMYPLIIGLLAIGKIFAYLSLTASGSNGVSVTGDYAAGIIAIVAYFGPYFLIPKTFELAGGAVARIGGIANDRSRGLFDRGKKYRQEQVALNRTANSENRRFNEKKYKEGSLRRRVAHRANNGFSKLNSNPWDTARIMARTAGGKAKLSEIDAAKFGATQQLSDTFGKKYGISNDRALATLAGRRFGKINNSKDLEGAIAGLRATGSAQDAVGATQLQNAYSLLTDLNSDPELGRASLEGAALMAWSAQGFANASDIAQVSNELGGGLGASVANQASFLGYSAGKRLDLKPTYGVQADANGQFFDGLSLTDANGQAKTGAALESAIQSQATLITGLKQHEITGAKSNTVRNIAAGARRIIEDGNPDKLRVERELAVRNGLGGPELAAFDADSAAKAARSNSMLQNVALSASAMSSADPESKQQWQQLQAELESSGIVPKAQMDKVRREVMDRSVDSATAGEEGITPGSGPGPRVR